MAGITLRILILLVPFIYSVYGEGYSFPKEFLFGAATAAYQVEGGWNEGGRGESIWDHQTHTRPDRFWKGQNGDVACDSYHKYKEDVQMLKSLGVNHYRFSISWTRILPNGRKDSLNREGIEYYNNLINELLDNGIEPFVTIYHWDLPQELQEMGGWPNRKMVHYYLDYARILFEHFGDRVKVWITFNELMQFCETGYSQGTMAPFIKNPGIGGYQCTHTVLLAHGMTYRMYEEEFKPTQGGRVGIVFDAFWQEPASDSIEDRRASQVKLEFDYGWFVNPVIYGNYPQEMIDRIGNMSRREGFKKSRLPEFTKQEQEMLTKSIDFLGLNYYTSQMVKFSDDAPDGHPSHKTDSGVVGFYDPSWEDSVAWWLKVTPFGLRNLLVWVKKQYGNIPVLVTENGYPDERGLQDYSRVHFMRSHLAQVLKAIHHDGCNVIGYTAWGLMDDFEWTVAYSLGFGLYHVDFNDPSRPRRPKVSAYVYQNIIETRKINWMYDPQLEFKPMKNVNYEIEFVSSASQLSTSLMYFVPIYVIYYLLNI